MFMNVFQGRFACYIEGRADEGRLTSGKDRIHICCYILLVAQDLWQCDLCTLYNLNASCLASDVLTRRAIEGLP